MSYAAFSYAEATLPATRRADGVTQHARKSTVMPSLSWTLHTDLKGCEETWRALERAADHRVFQSYAWIAAWYAEIGAAEGISPRIVLGWHAGLPQLLIPLGCKRKRGVRCLTWLAGTWSDYNAPIVAPDIALPECPNAIAALWREIADVAGPADILELSRQPACLATGRTNFLRHPNVRVEDNRAHARTLRDPDGRPRLPIYGGRTLAGFDRKMRKLRREGEVEFVLLNDRTRAREAVNLMVNWKYEALARRGGTNPFADEAARRFLMRVVESGWPAIRVYALNLDSVPVAVILCLVEYKSLLIYQLAFDERFSKTSPGQQSLRMLAEVITDEGFEMLDFSFGDDPYKDALCDRQTELSRTMLPLTMRGTIAAFVGKCYLGLRRRAKKNRILYFSLLKLNRNMRKLAVSMA